MRAGAIGGKEARGGNKEGGSWEEANAHMGTAREDNQKQEHTKDVAGQVIDRLWTGSSRHDARRRQRP